MPPDVRPVVVASHPRSGTHLLIDTLRRQFEACGSWKWPGERLDRLYCNIDELSGGDLLDETTARRILRRTEQPVVKTHGDPEYRTAFLDSHAGGLGSQWVEWLDDHSTRFYVYRDGRDVLCSYQLFRQSFDPSARGPIGEFLRQSDRGISRVRRWARHVRMWLDQPDVHAVRFEDLLEAPEKVLQRIGNALGESLRERTPLLPRPFRSIWESRWARLCQTRPESTAIINGESKDWKECFTHEDRAFFHEEAGDLLTELGYEKSETWVHSH